MSDLSIVLRSLAVRRFSTTAVVLLVAMSAGLLLAILSLRTAGARAFGRGTGNAHATHTKKIAYASVHANMNAVKTTERSHRRPERSAPTGDGCVRITGPAPSGSGRRFR